MLVTNSRPNGRRNGKSPSLERADDVSSATPRSCCKSTIAPTERIGDERPDDLTVLCRKCHGHFHDGRGVRSAKKRKTRAKKQPCSVCGHIWTTKGICRPCRNGRKRKPEPVEDNLGPLSIPCPVCFVRSKRKCAIKRGTHKERVGKWLDMVDTRDRATRTANGK